MADQKLVSKMTDEEKLAEQRRRDEQGHQRRDRVSGESKVEEKRATTDASSASS